MTGANERCTPSVHGTQVVSPLHAIRNMVVSQAAWHPISYTACQPMRHGIPRGMVSHAEWYPARWHQQGSLEGQEGENGLRDDVEDDMQQDGLIDDSSTLANSPDNLWGAFIRQVAIGRTTMGPSSAHRVCGTRDDGGRRQPLCVACCRYGVWRMVCAPGR